MNTKERYDYNLKWRKDNPDKVKEYREKHKGYQKAYQAEYRRKNSDKINALQRANRAKKKALQPPKPPKVKIPKPPKPKPEKPIKDKFVRKDEFLNEIKHYYEKGVFSDRLGELILNIAIKLSNHPRFINYTYKDEMVSDAIERMCLAIKNKNFNVDSDFNPFSYFSRIAWNSFFNRLNMERRSQTTKENLSRDLHGVGDYQTDIYYKSNETLNNNTNDYDWNPDDYN